MPGARPSVLIAAQPTTADAGIDRPGDRVLVDRLRWLGAGRAAWEVVALDCPDDAGRNCASSASSGCPAKRIEIRDGDVLVDGHVARKSLAEQRAVAVLVHDAARATDDRRRTLRGGATRAGIGGATARHSFIRRTPRRKTMARTICWRRSTGWSTITRREVRRPAVRPTGRSWTKAPTTRAESRLLHPVRDVLVRGAITGRGPGQRSPARRIGGRGIPDHDRPGFRRLARLRTMDASSRACKRSPSCATGRCNWNGC